MSNTLILDIRVNGYRGQPTRLVATLNTDNGLLYVSGEKPYNQPKKEHSLLDLIKVKSREQRTVIVTNSPDVFDKWDLLFKEDEHMQEIVRAYQMRTANKLLKIDPSVMGKFNPENVLQHRKLDVKLGSVWDMSTEVENGHVCILLACWAAMRSMVNHSFAHQINNEAEHDIYGETSLNLDEPFTI